MPRRSSVFPLFLSVPSETPLRTTGLPNQPSGAFSDLLASACKSGSPPPPPLAPLSSSHLPPTPPSTSSCSGPAYSVSHIRPTGRFPPPLPPASLQPLFPQTNLPQAPPRRPKGPRLAPPLRLQPGPSFRSSAPSVAAGSVLLAEGSTRGITKIEEQLSLILESLGHTQERLTAIETSIQRCQSDITSGQQEIAELRKSGYQRHDQLDRIIRAADAKTGRLSESFAAARGDRTVVQKAVSGTEKIFSRLSEAVKIAQDQLLDLDCRTQTAELYSATQPALLAPQARLLKMEESINHTQSRLLVVEKSSSRVQDDLSVVQRLVGTHSHLLLTERASGPRRVSAENELDRGVPAAEVKTDELEKSLEETKKDVSSIRKHLRAMDRQAPIMEGKVVQLEKVVGEVRLSLDSVGGHVAGLGLRVTAIEANTSALIGASETTGAYGDVRCALGGSPAVYPSRDSDCGLDGSPPLRLRELSPSPS